MLTEAHLRLPRMHRGRITGSEQNVEARRRGFLLCQDTYFIGTIKGVGKIYHQTVVDAHCLLALAKLHLSKVPMTAVDFLNDRVLPSRSTTYSPTADAKPAGSRCRTPSSSF